MALSAAESAIIAGSGRLSVSRSVIRATRKDRVEKLGKRGILAFEVDGILARLTKKSTQDFDLRNGLIPVISIAAVLAHHIRARVRDQRQLATGSGGQKYSRKNLTMARDVRAAAKGGLANYRGPSLGAPRGGLYMLTGDMWDNLEAVSSGRNGARIGFRASGHGTNMGKPRWIGGLKYPVRSPRAVKIRNQTKANIIYEKKGDHILEPTWHEQMAMADAIGNASADAISAFFGGQRVTLVRSPGSNASLARKIEALWA